MARKSSAAALASVITLSSAVIVVGEEKQTVPPGTLIDLPKAEAEDGVARGLFATPDQYRAPAAAKPSRPEEPEEVIAAIVERLRSWGKGDQVNEEWITASGKPAVAVLEKQLGYDITAEERDAAFEEVRASLV
jgi:hypothetical protein